MSSLQCVVFGVVNKHDNDIIHIKFTLMPLFFIRKHTAGTIFRLASFWGLVLNLLGN